MEAVCVEAVYTGIPPQLVFHVLCGSRVCESRVHLQVAAPAGTPEAEVQGLHLIRHNIQPGEQEIDSED